MANNNGNGNSTMVVSIVAAMVVALMAAVFGFASTHRNVADNTVCMSLFGEPEFNVTGASHLVPTTSPTREPGTILVVYSDDTNANPHRAQQSDKEPLIMTPDMHNGRIEEPVGAVNAYSAKNLNCKKVSLLSYDDTAFTAKNTRDGFTLTAKNVGRAWGTEVRRDGEKYWTGFAFDAQ